MQKPHAHRRWLVYAGIVALVVGGYAAAGFLGVPALVDSQARQVVKSRFGRDLAIGRIHFNPFTLTLEVDKLRLPDADGGPLLGFDRLTVNLGMNSLWRRALSFEAIALDDPVIHAVIRPDGTLNLADLDPGAPAGTPPAGKAPLPRVVIDDLRINNGQVRYEDRHRAVPFLATVSPVTFQLENFSTFAAGERYQLDARLFETGHLAWRGSLSARPLESRGEFSLTDIPLPRVAGFLGDAVPLVVAGGRASLRGEYHLAADDFSIDDGAAGITSLAIRPRGGDLDYIQLANVVASGLKLGLAARRAEAGKLVVHGGSLQAWISPGGELNLAALAGPAPVAAAAPSTASTTRKPWLIQVPDVELDGLAVHLEDRRLKPAATMVLQPLQLGIKGFSTAPGTAIHSRLAATINGTGHATMAAVTQLDTLDSTVDLDISGLPLDMVQPYVAAETSMTLTGGTLGAKGKATYAAAPPGGNHADAAVSFDGDIVVDRLHTIDNALKEDFVKWDRLGIGGLHYQTAPQRLRIRAVDLRRPYARVVIAPDGTSNISAILAGPGATATAAPGPTLAPAGDAGTATTAITKAPTAGTTGPALPFPVRIGVIRIRNGAARFADLTTRPNFDIGIGELQGTISGLSSTAGSHAKVVLDGQVNEFSPVTIRGEVNPLAAETFMDMSMTLRNVELASFTPYSGRFAGYSIRKGKLSADLGYRIQDRKLDADHKFVIAQLELGNKVSSPEATSLPLKLAVALLKDRNGIIDLDLPVTGDIDDPRFRVGPIVWKAFVNLVTKAATAPFALLGNLFGGGAEINKIDFAPGMATLDAGDLDRLGSLAKALAERPGLNLSVPATFNRAADLPALRQVAFEQKVAGFRSKPGMSPDYAAITADPDNYRKILEDLYRQEYGQGFTPPGADRDQPGNPPEPVIPLLETAVRSRIPVGDNELFALARARATAIQERLLAGTGIDPVRVFLTAPAEGPADAAGVVLELALR